MHCQCSAECDVSKEDALEVRLIMSWSLKHMELRHVSSKNADPRMAAAAAAVALGSTYSCIHCRGIAGVAEADSVRFQGGFPEISTGNRGL